MSMAVGCCCPATTSTANLFDLGHSGLGITVNEVPIYTKAPPTVMHSDESPSLIITTAAQMTEEGEEEQ